MRYLTEWVCDLPQIMLDNVVTTWYNDCVVNEKGKKMIIRRETLNEISTLKALGYPVFRIAALMNLAIGDVAAAIKAFKL